MKIKLRNGKDKAIRNRHHWIFSGAVESLPEGVADGQIVPVVAAKEELLGHAYFNRNSSIVGRMVSFGKAEPLAAIKKNLQNAFGLRDRLVASAATNVMRRVNGEGDFLPGLIVDQYDRVLVIQVSTLGMEMLLPQIVEWLRELCDPICIYEKSVLPSRKEEGLAEVQRVLFGELPEVVLARENGWTFEIPILEGQKTGFFIDHREMRAAIGKLSAGKRVLNCFGYTGGFSVYCAGQRAAQVTTVEISAKALALAEKNFAHNQMDASVHRFVKEDVFDFLRKEPLNYEIVILDPPAFAKKQKDVNQACRGYKEINRLAIQKMPPKSLLLTCSCSYHVPEELFQTVVFQAAAETNRNVRIIGRHHLAADHPVNICHRESDYLKSLLLYIE